MIMHKQGKKQKKQPDIHEKYTAAPPLRVCIKYGKNEYIY